MIDKLNGNFLKWIIVSLIPAVLAVGAWAGVLQNQVVNLKETRAEANEDRKEIKKEIKKVNKQLTAILCTVAPDKCPVD